MEFKMYIPAIEFTTKYVNFFLSNPNASQKFKHYKYVWNEKSSSYSKTLCFQN